MSIVYLFYEVFIILEIKVVLISYSSSKAESKAAETNELLALIKPPTDSTLHDQSVVLANRRWLPSQTAVTAVS